MHYLPDLLFHHQKKQTTYIVYSMRLLFDDYRLAKEMLLNICTETSFFAFLLSSLEMQNQVEVPKQALSI